MPKRFLLCSLFCAVCVAQGSPPVNGWYTGREYFPWQKAKDVYCVYFKTQDLFTGAIKEVPANGVTVSAIASVQPGSGYHVHSQSPRPYPTIINQTPSDGRTDATGCVTYTWTSAGNLAGWITFQHSAIGPFPTNGVNSRYRYLDSGPNNSKIDFEQYPESLGLIVNQPFGNHPDTRHNPSPAGGFDNARYGTPASAHLALRISESYFALSAGMIGNAIPLDLIRGSLPDGGLADNETGADQRGPYVSPEWAGRANEYHQLGVEWDFGNPLLINSDVRAWSLFQSVIYGHACVFGAATPDGTAIDPNLLMSYWSGKPVVHVACSVGRAAQ
jgi:hypothetical protein